MCNVGAYYDSSLHKCLHTLPRLLMICSSRMAGWDTVFTEINLSTNILFGLCYISAVCSCCVRTKWSHLYIWWLWWKHVLGVRSVTISVHVVTTYSNKVTSETNSDKYTIYRSAERYDPREGFWVRLPSMSTRRGCHTLTVLGDTLSVIFSDTSELFLGR